MCCDISSEWRKGSAIQTTALSFGIRARSNVFSAATYDLHGKIFDPRDVADSFSYPYIKYRSAKEELP